MHLPDRATQAAAFVLILDKGCPQRHNSVSRLLSLPIPLDLSIEIASANMIDSAGCQANIEEVSGLEILAYLMPDIFDILKIRHRGSQLNAGLLDVVVYMGL